MRIAAILSPGTGTSTIVAFLSEKGRKGFPRHRHSSYCAGLPCETRLQLVISHVDSLFHGVKGDIRRLVASLSLTAALAVTLSVLTPVAPALADDAPAIKPVEIGATVPRLEFRDIRSLKRSLADLPQGKACVLAFSTTDCPVARRYWPVLKALAAEFGPREVRFVAVNVGPGDAIRDMAEQAIDFEIEFPIVKDFDALAARSLGIGHVPEVAVLDADRRLRYRGRIDDQHYAGGSRAAPTTQELRDALEAILAGREVAVTETSADGCAVSEQVVRTFSRTVTYADDIAPLIKKHCAMCHRAGTAAPFALGTYDDAVSHAETIAEVVRDERMPPWFGDSRHRDFVNRRGLTRDERALIAQWVRTGKSRGDASQVAAPNLPAGVDGPWLIGKPDVITTELVDHQIPATGILPYQHVVLPYVFLRETWLDGIQILPDNPAVVHHCNSGYIKLGELISTDNFITGYVPGGDPMKLPRGTALRIPAGSVIALQIHFVTTGKPERCRLSVGIRYTREIVQKQLRFLYLADHRFAIPPGAALHPVQASRTLDRDAIGVGMFAHMHLRGRDMTFVAHRPGEQPDPLLVIPNYSFAWQHAYEWPTDTVRFPRGTRIECLAHYDNSAFNPYNPDPTATVRVGPQTYHEMMNGFFFYVDADESLSLEINPNTGGAKKASREQSSAATP